MSRVKLVLFYTVAFFVVSISAVVGCSCVERC